MIRPEHLAGEPTVIIAAYEAGAVDPLAWLGVIGLIVVFVAYLRRGSS